MALLKLASKRQLPQVIWKDLNWAITSRKICHWSLALTRLPGPTKKMELNKSYSSQELSISLSQISLGDEPLDSYTPQH